MEGSVLKRRLWLGWVHMVPMIKPKQQVVVIYNYVGSILPQISTNILLQSIRTMSRQAILLIYLCFVQSSSNFNNSIFYYTSIYWILHCVNCFEFLEVINTNGEKVKRAAWFVLHLYACCKCQVNSAGHYCNFV